MRALAANANIVILAGTDNVGVALRDIETGDDACDILGQRVTAREDIPAGHKIALREIAAREAVVRFGMAVGEAVTPIETGQLVHVHNVRSRYINNDEDHYE